MAEIYDAVGDRDGREVRRYWIDGIAYWFPVDEGSSLTGTDR